MFDWKSVGGEILNSSSLKQSVGSMQQVHTSQISSKEPGHNANSVMIQQPRNHFHTQTLAISSFLGFLQISHLYFEIQNLLIFMYLRTGT